VKPGLPLARLENLFAQSCRRYRVDGFIRSADDLVSVVVRISGSCSIPAASFCGWV
jgi:hypothetical protein